MENVLFLFLPRFWPIFHFNLCNFCSWGRKNIFCLGAQGTLATPLIIPFNAERQARKLWIPTF